VKRVCAKRYEATTSQNDPSLTEGLGKASTIADCRRPKSKLKPKKQYNPHPFNTRTAPNSRLVAHESKNLLPGTSSNHDIRQIDSLQLYNTLLALKGAPRTNNRSHSQSTGRPAPTDRAPILTSAEASQIFKISIKTFLARYAPLLHPIPSKNCSSRRRHLRWSRSEIERMAHGHSFSELKPEAPNEDLNYVRRELEKRLE